MSEHQNILDFLAELALLKGLSCAGLKMIENAGRRLRFEKDQTVFAMGEMPTGAYFVVSGMIKKSCISPTGKEKVIEIFGECESLGFAALFHGSIYSYSAIAIEPSELFYIDKSDFFTIMDDHPSILHNGMRTLAMQTLSLLSHIENITVKDHTSRVADYLFRLVPESKSKTSKPIALPVMKCVIASKLSMTPESLSRRFRDLSEAGIIRMQGDSFEILHPHLLKSLLDEG